MSVEVTRESNIQVNQFQVGDVITMTMTDGSGRNPQEHKAIAVKEESDGMVFCMLSIYEQWSLVIVKEDQSGSTRYNMFDLSLADYQMIVEWRLIRMFPEAIQNMMVPFADGKKIRIPTEKEMFGVNTYGAEEAVSQWAPMADKRNRLAPMADGSLPNIWTMTKVNGSDIRMAVEGAGGLYITTRPIWIENSSTTIKAGMRLVFKLNPNA